MEPRAVEAVVLYVPFQLCLSLSLAVFVILKYYTDGFVLGVVVP